MNFNFPLASAVVDGVNSGNANRIRQTLRDVISAYPQGIIDAPFLTNHDQTRLATVLGNDAGKLRNAAAILLTLPGAPFIYYGEEVGLQNGPTSADESKRTPMPWTASGGFTTGTPWFAVRAGIRDEQRRFADQRSAIAAVVLPELDRSAEALPRPSERRHHAARNRLADPRVRPRLWRRARPRRAQPERLVRERGADDCQRQRIRHDLRRQRRGRSDWRLGRVERRAAAAQQRRVAHLR